MNQQGPQGLPPGGQREKLLCLRFLLSERNLSRIVSGVSEGHTTTIHHLFRDVVSQREIQRQCNKIIHTCENAVAYDTTNHETVETLRVTGQTLFSLLFGPDVADVLRSEAPTSLLLEIDDALLFVPWELLHDGVGFLAEQFNLGRIVVTRWPQRRPLSGVGKRPLRILILANPGKNLEGAAQEGQELHDFLSQLRPHVSVHLPQEPITEDRLRQMLWDYDIVHYAGDASYNRSGLYRGSLQLHQRDTLTAKKVRDLAALHRAAPLLVFVNACWAGKTERWFDQAKVYGLAHAFLSLGVRHFIGTLWAIPDEAVSPIEFAKKTYEEMAQGKSIGEAVRLARLTLRQKYGDTSITGLSYVLYGDPTFTLFAEPLPLASPLQELLTKGIRLENQVQWDKALGRYFDFEKAMHAEADQSILPDLFLRIGALLARQGEFGNAQAYLEKIPAPAQRPDALNELALIHYKQGNLEKARQLCEQSLAQLDKAPESFQKGQALHYLGLVKRAKREMAAAGELFEEARAIYDRLGYVEGLAQLYDSLGSLYFDKGNIDAALACYFSSKQAKEWLGDRYGLAITHGSLGRAYLVLGKWQQAKDHFERDLELAQELPDERAVALMHNHIGEALIGLGKYEAAAASYRQAMKLYRRQKDLVGLAFSQRGVAEALLQLNKRDAALAVAQQAMQVFQQRALVDPAGYAKWTLGKVYAQRGDMEQAEQMFQESVQAFHDLQLPIERAEVEFDFGLMYLEKGLSSKAEAHLRKAFNIPRSQGMSWLINKFSDRLRNMRQEKLLKKLTRGLGQWAQ